MNILDRIATMAYSTNETVYNSFALAKTMEDSLIHGDFVECGVGAGAQIMAMRVAAPKRVIWGFDSFEGIPLAGENDDEQPGIGKIMHDKTMTLEKRLVSSGVTVHSKENVIKNFEQLKIPIGNTVLVKGWFQHTLYLYNIKIALLRLDGDLYESTMIALQEFYPKVVTGGVIIVDDYALSGCRKAVKDYFSDKEFPKNIVSVAGSGGVVYWFK